MSKNDDLEPPEPKPMGVCHSKHDEWNPGYIAKLKRAQRAAKQIADADDSTDEQVEDEKHLNTWGRGRSAYYDASEHSGEDELNYEEAQRITEQKWGKLSMKDFGLEDVEREVKAVSMKGRTKYKVHVHARIGATTSKDDLALSESEDEFYQYTKRQRTEKLCAYLFTYDRTPGIQPMGKESKGDGKRKISYQIEKNKGLTRSRNMKNNPRKNYSVKHQKMLNKRKGQVRLIMKPSGPYGGERSGINPNVSRSVRFKS
ncbi:hypothetical protein EJB05_51549 [Eragrostis curvula]|uniref:Sas10 C-terminal domain-containing protein n=1 Tax=Eragrostis curvula TaxID=38414 RepID=A0A5J9SV83_9POAL|nr:hypothetical protein EJB05_51549 [Eragrostis curvula]